MFLAFVATLAFGFEAAAPIPAHLIPPPASFPLKIGTEWVYAVTGDEEAKITETILSVEGKEGIQTVRIRVAYQEFVKGAAGMTTIYIRQLKVSRVGLFYVAPWPEIAGSEICLLKLPPKSDSKWEEDHPKMRLKRKCAATKVEEVKTAAGKYQALRVETVYAIEGQKEIRFSEDWYAPGVGLVKQRRLDTNREQLLKSFTPGRD